MKRAILSSAMLFIALSAMAQADSLKPVFTTVKEIPITSVKNQARSGTCWNYSTLSFFEAEILKKSKKTYDLCRYNSY